MSDSSQNQAQKSFDFKFAQIPNILIDAWLSGKISDPCFKLVTICLRHSETFHVKYNYLHNHCGMHESTIKKAKEEAVFYNLLKVEKIREGRSTKVQFSRVHESEWKLDLNNFTNSLVSHSEVSDSELSDSEVSYYKNTNPKNTNSKKTKNKKINVCEERARVRVYDQTNRLEERHTHTGWVSNYSPETIINRLADLGCIKTSGKGFIENVTFWNKEARDSLGALETDQLTEFIVYTKKSLGSSKLKPTEGSLANMLTAWRLREKEAISEEPQYFEETDYLEVKDDCPF